MLTRHIASQPASQPASQTARQTDRQTDGQTYIIIHQKPLFAGGIKKNMSTFVAKENPWHLYTIQK